uniref:(northern house mosquito) hypothetical protein n=1 Tax=Culex pipiens TaxID=7175 RepID=A0A8D8J5N5_CULPI
MVPRVRLVIRRSFPVESSNRLTFVLLEASVVASAVLVGMGLFRFSKLKFNRNADMFLSRASAVLVSVIIGNGNVSSPQNITSSSSSSSSGAILEIRHVFSCSKNAS